MAPDIRPYGDRALLACDVADPAAWARGLRRLASRRGVADALTELVPAAEAVLVVCRDGQARERVRAIVPDVTAAVGHDDPAAVVTLRVRYDGADLCAVADACGLTVAELVERHATTELVAAFCGFSPGFAYLTGLPAELHVPRRASPRTSVPPGSVAIAGPYCAVYPHSSPGGWNLLGHTDAVLFDPDASPPAVLQPGTRVRFAAV